MNIVVCIKQVPETGNVRMDEETGTMVREGVESIVNPLDLYAIEAAIRLKQEHDGRITVVSMGPPSAEKAVREAISMGCEAGVLVTGREFAGSDTHATSYCISRAVQKLSPCDLVLMGVRATDGETGQVGPGVAAFLGMPLCTYASRIGPVDGESITIERLVETGYETLRLPFPCVVTVGKEIGHPRLSTLRGKQRARRAEVLTWGADDLGVEPDLLGLKGSPTRVVKIARPKVNRSGRMLDVARLGAHEAARQLVDFLEEKDLL
ncbi:MAG: electron transfer flavoprotein subunit beta/FixA family protein [Candidatus Brocadiae bacterium]|nr:electron transfer flavoprotein subunit beta/FixA family protein [Candidatus Brocadiia bacterium]